MEINAAPGDSGETRFVANCTPPRWALLALLCLALMVRGRVMRSNADSLFKDSDAYGDMSLVISQEHTIGLWRESMRTVVPTATRPPLYPVLLSIFNSLFSNSSPYLFGWFHVVLGVGTVWSVWRLGQLWGLSPGGSLLAAGLTAVDPILLGQSVQVMTETLATFMAGMTLIALSHSARETSWRWTALAGALLGLCGLCRPTFLLWGGACALAYPWRASGTRTLARAGALVVIAAAVLVPWAVRNQKLFGRPIFTTTHGGYTLLVANNPGFYEFLRSAPWGGTCDAKEIFETWRSRQDVIHSPAGPVMDEAANDQWAYAQAWENIRREPLMFAYACIDRWGRLFGVMPHQASPDESIKRRGLRHAIAIWYVFELLLAAAGAWYLGRGLLRAPWIWGTLLVLSVWAVHTLYWTDMRMRAPFVIVIVLLAAEGATELASKRRVSSAVQNTT